MEFLYHAALGEKNFESASVSDKRLSRMNWPTYEIRLGLNIDSGLYSNSMLQERKETVVSMQK